MTRKQMIAKILAPSTTLDELRAILDQIRCAAKSRISRSVYVPARGTVAFGLLYR